MDAGYKQLTDFLVALGTDQVPHTEGYFLAHLVGVYRELKAWGAEGPVCCAGMFHSIYGTEMFQDFSLSLERRDEVRQLIGERGEHLAYLNCAMVRSSFDANLSQADLEHGSRFQMIDRFAGHQIELSPREFDDLCAVHLFDWLEQVPRYRRWTYRREAFKQMAVRLGEKAQAAYDRVYAQETA